MPFHVECPLAGLRIYEARAGVIVTCPKTSLVPGESMTCTASGTAVAGQYANIGTAKARRRPVPR